MGEIELLNQLIDITKIEVENIKAENKRLRTENERLLGIIEKLTCHDNGRN